MKQLATTRNSILILTLVMVFSACKKDKESISDNTITTLQNKNWKISALTVTPGFSGQGTDDLYNTSMEVCEQDNLFRFNAGNVFILDEGPTKCDPTDPQSETGTWNYNASTSTLNIQQTSPTDAVNLKIVSINENSFVGKQTENVGGVNYAYTWTFSKQ